MSILSSSPALAKKLAAMKAARAAPAKAEAETKPEPKPLVPLSDEPTQIELIQSKLVALEDSLLAGTPGMPTLLRDIHSTLAKDPAIVTLLSEEECATLVSGLKKQTGVEIATKLVKAKGKSKVSKASLAKLTVDDL